MSTRHSSHVGPRGGPGGGPGGPGPERVVFGPFWPFWGPGFGPPPGRGPGGLVTVLCMILGGPGRSKTGPKGVPKWPFWRSGAGFGLGPLRSLGSCRQSSHGSEVGSRRGSQRLLEGFAKGTRFWVYFWPFWAWVHFGVPELVYI